MKAGKKIAAFVLAASLWTNSAYAVNYQVQAGDSLYKLASKYDLTLSEFNGRYDLSRAVSVHPRGRSHREPYLHRCAGR